MTKQQTPAQAIKKELKTVFPWIQFSCTYNVYSLWDSVHISWEDWPTDTEVEKIVWKYQYWTFNSYEDIYEITNRKNDIPQAKYIQTRRELSEENREKIKTHIQSSIHLDEYELTKYIWKFTQKIAIPVGKKIEAIQWRADNVQVIYSDA